MSALGGAPKAPQGGSSWAGRADPAASASLALPEGRAERRDFDAMCNHR